MQTTEEKNIIEEFSWFEDPIEKYEYIIELGKGLPPYPEAYKTDHYLVKGCQSKVWLHSYEKDGNIVYEADSNTVITKGIIALLIRVLSNIPPSEVINHPLSFIDEINLHGHLTSQRSNGLSAMIKKMKHDAFQYV